MPTNCGAPTRMGQSHFSPAIESHPVTVHYSVHRIRNMHTSTHVCICKYVEYIAHIDTDTLCVSLNVRMGKASGFNAINQYHQNWWIIY